MEYWRKIRHVAPALTVGVLGVIVSVLAWYLTSTTETRAFVQEFDSRAHNQAIILQDGIDDYWDKLYAVKHSSIDQTVVFPATSLSIFRCDG